MKELLLMRHAKAEDYENSEPDYDRVLRDVGRRNAADIAASISRDRPRPDLLIASGAARALETARIVAAELGVDESSIVIEDSLYGASPGGYQAVIHQVSNDYQAIALFAHNPGIESMAHWLMHDFQAFMPTASVVSFRLNIERWEDLDPGNGDLLYYKTVLKRFPGNLEPLAEFDGVEIGAAVVTVRNADLLRG